MIKKIRRWIAFIYLVPIIWMAFEPSRVMPFFRIPFIGYIVAMVALVLVSNRYLMRNEFWLAFIYGFVVFLNFRVGNVAFPSFFSVLYEIFRLLVPAAIFFYYRNNRNKLFVNVVLLSYIFIISFEALATYRLEQEFPGLMRNLSASRYDEERVFFMQMGLAPYSLPHALPTLLPAVILVLKDQNNRLIYRILSIVFLVASFIIIYLSQATGAYLMAVFSLVLAMIVDSRGVQNNIRKLVIVFSLVVPFAIIPSFTNAVLDIAEMVVSTESDVYEKIEEVRASNSGIDADGDIAYRGELLGKTIDTIIQHPLLGSRTKTYGNHNGLIDRWAKLGLVGFLPLLLFLTITIKNTYKIIPDKGKTYYVVGVISAIIMLSFKNQVSWDQWFLLFYLLPVLIIENYGYGGLKKTEQLSS